MRPRSVLPATLAALALLAPATAHASGSAVIRDCTDDGRLSKTYSQKDYRDALKNIPTDVDEYTDCRDVIRRAQLGAAGGGGSGSSGGGSTGAGGGAATGGSGGGPQADPLATASPSERQAVEHARSTGDKPVQVAGATVRPTALTHGDLGTLNSLPAPVIAAFVLLALGAAGAAGYYVRTRVLARGTQA